MNDFLFGMAISVVLSVVQSVIKKPATKAKYFAAMRKIAIAILNAYPELLTDPSVARIRKVKA